MRTQHVDGSAWLGFLVRILPAGKGTRRKVSVALAPKRMASPTTALVNPEFVQKVIAERDEALNDNNRLRQDAVRDAQEIYDLKSKLELANWANEMNRRSKRDLLAPIPAPHPGEATAIPLMVDRTIVVRPLHETAFAKTSPEPDTEVAGIKVNSLVV